MKQTIRILSALLAACLMLTAFGCLVKDDADTTALPPTASPDVESNDAPAVPTGDRNAVAIKLDEIEITAGEIEDNYNSYMQMLSYYGMTAPTDDASIKEYVQMIVEELVSQQLPLWKAKQQGIELSEEELKKIDADAHNDADAEYTDLVLSYASYFTDAGEVNDISELSEEQLVATIEALNADVQTFYGDTTSDIDVYISDAYDNYYKQYLISAYADKLRAQNDEGITVDDETIEAWYGNAFAEQKELFDSDPTQYRAHHDNLTLGENVDPLLYVPEGMALIKLITLTPDGEVPASFSENEQKMADLESEYGKLSLNGGNAERLAAISEEYATLAEQNASVEAEFFAKEREAADAAYTRLQAGEAFDAVATDVTGAAPIVHLIWYAGEDYNFSETVRNAVSTLAEGAYSEVLFDGESYYIVCLVGHLTAGAVDRAPIAEAIAAAAAVETRDAAWEELTEAWEQEAMNAATFHTDAYAYVGH